MSELARQLKVPRSVLQDWIDGKQPSFSNVEYLVRIADYLNLSLEELLVGKDIQSKILTSIVFDDDGRRYQVSINRVK